MAGMENAEKRNGMNGRAVYFQRDAMPMGRSGGDYDRQWVCNGGRAQLAGEEV